jgi:hypothetical protein
MAARANMAVLKVLVASSHEAYNAVLRLHHIIIMPVMASGLTKSLPQLYKMY